MIFKLKIIFLVFMTFAVYRSQAEPIEHPYFWKVEKGGKTSYILGIMHVAVSMEGLMEPMSVFL